MTASIPGPPPPPSSGGGGGNLVPRKVWAGYVEVGEFGPRGDQPQRVACYWCVKEGAEVVVPQVYVMVGGYSACLTHAHKSGTG